MIRRVFAVATLTLRGTIRSGALVGLTLLLLFLMITPPLTMKGSGSPESNVYVLLYYTLGCAWVIIMVATLFLSCAEISRDIEQERMRLVAAKPVRKSEIWLGKWFGMIAINAVLLVIVGLSIVGLLGWKNRSWDPETKTRLSQTVLVANRTVPPRAENISDDLERIYQIELDHIKNQGRSTTAFQRNRIRGSIRHTLLTDYAQVSPGNGKSWRIDIPQETIGKNPMALHINFSPLSGEIRSEHGSWSLSTGRDTSVVFEDKIVAGMGNRILLPEGFVQPGETLKIRFENGTGGTSIVFDPETAVELRIREHSFAWNLICSLLVIFFQLALLSAFGLAVGTFFSYPVATFVATSIVFLSMAAHYFVVSEGSDVLSPVGVQPREQSIFHAVGETMVLGLESISGPVLRLSSLARLSNGLLVSLGSVFHAIVVVASYSTVLSFISCIYLSRRDLEA